MLFLIGFEFEIKDIYTRQNVAIAIGGVSIPWIAGYLIAELLSPPLLRWLMRGSISTKDDGTGS